MRTGVFFFNDTATTEIYTPFPTRRSSDLPPRRSTPPPRPSTSTPASGGPTGTSGPSGSCARRPRWTWSDRKSTRLNSSHANNSYAVFCLKKKKALYHTHYPLSYDLHQLLF